MPQDQPTEVKSFRDVEGNGHNQVVVGGDEPVPLGRVGAVYAADDHYIVYTDPVDHFWYTGDSTIKDSTQEFNALWSQVQEVTALPWGNAQKVKKSIFASLATAVGCALVDDYTTASRAVDQARAVLLEASERQAKAWFMPATAMVGFGASILGLCLFIWLCEFEESSRVSLGRVVAASIAGGSIGALLSALGRRNPESAFNPFATRSEAWTDGCLRILYGIVTAFVVTLAAEAEFILSLEVAKNKADLSLLIVAIAGGFLERWAVDIIRSVRPSDETNG